MWVVAAFLALGFLVGQLVGLSATSVTSAILGFLFAFGGGSAISFMKGIDPGERKLAAKAILALSVSCLLGIYAAIYVTEQQLLTRDKAVAVNRVTSADRKYLRSVSVPAVQLIDQRLANGDLSLKQAYMELYELVTREESTK